MHARPYIRTVIAVAAMVGAASTIAHAEAPRAQAGDRYRPPVTALEVSEDQPMPPGFGVQPTDADGPVFVDSHGVTLYIWPLSRGEIGEVGDRKGKPSVCDNVKQTENTGFMSIYSGGHTLPDLDTRPTCTEAWPPVYAAADAKPVSSWTLLERTDGRKQWAYEGQPLYTSSLDIKPGEVNGGIRLQIPDGRRPLRQPVGPPAAHPPAFAVQTVVTGRILTDYRGFVVYASNADGPGRSNCDAACLTEWEPIQASQAAQPHGEWKAIDRAPGAKQWTFRDAPLYIHRTDKLRSIVGARGVSLEGSDAPGWRAVYTQKWPDPPKEFTVQDSRIGQVLADKHGMTLYSYICVDEALDQLACDHPTTTQAYRLAICGRGDAAMCNSLFLYVPAPPNVKVDNLIWGTTWIDPKTGHHATYDAPGALHVWTFRDKPIYTHGRDKQPGDVNGDAWGEGVGYRNGYKAIWIRDDFAGNAG